MPCPNYKTFTGYRDLCRTSLQCAVVVKWDGVEFKDLQSGCDSPLGAGFVLAPMRAALVLPLLVAFVLGHSWGEQSHGLW